MSSTPHWVAFPVLLYAFGCLYAAYKAEIIPEVARRMRTGPRQRVLAHPKYVLFVRAVAVFGFLTAFSLALLILRR